MCYLDLVAWEIMQFIEFLKFIISIIMIEKNSKLFRKL